MATVTTPADERAGIPPPVLASSERPAGRWLRNWTDRLSDDDTMFEIVGAMTLVIVLLTMEGRWYLQAPGHVLCVGGLVFRQLRRRAAFWLVLTAVLVFGHAILWFSIDNHMYLITYWCLALGVAHLARNPAQVLASNARWLIGLCFLFATMWKLISPEYVSSDFFHYTLITDNRFGGFVSIVGGAPDNLGTSNLYRLEPFVTYDSPVDPVTLSDVPRIAPLALFLTWWTVVIEAGIALCFLWAVNRGPSRLRDAFLGVFLLSSYAIATVLGFGWILAAMGLAQSRRSPLRLVYIVAFLLLPVYAYLPFRSFYFRLFG